MRGTALYRAYVPGVWGARRRLGLSRMKTQAEAPDPLPPAGLAGHMGRLVVVGGQNPLLVVVVEGHVTPVGIVVG